MWRHHRLAPHTHHYRDSHGLDLESDAGRAPLCVLQCGCVFPLRLTVPLVLEVVGAKSKKEGQSLIRVAGQEDEDERLRTLRRRLHERIGLPLNRPAFRTTAALQLAGPQAPVGGPTERLRDVHIGVGASGVQDGRQYLVDGTYLYYHYMQGG